MNKRKGDKSYLVNRIAVPIGDQWVVEVMEEYNDRWDVWSFGSSHNEAHENAVAAKGTYKKIRIRRTI